MDSILGSDARLHGGREDMLEFVEEQDRSLRCEMVLLLEAVDLSVVVRFMWWDFLRGVRGSASCSAKGSAAGRLKQERCMAGDV